MKKIFIIIIIIMLIGCTVSLIAVKNSENIKIENEVNSEQKVKIDSLKLRK